MVCKAVQPVAIRSIEQYEKVWFDAAHQAFLLLRNGTFSVWSPNTNDEKSGIPLPFYHDHLILPKNIILAKISLDLQLIAAQITPTRIMVFDITNHNRWTIDIKHPTENRILPEGIVWSEHGGNSQDLILVTIRGLEMYKISSTRNQCKLSRTVSQGVPHSFHACFWYEPNHRCMVLASPFKSTEAEMSGASRSANSGRRPSNSGTLSDSNHSSLALNGYFFRSERADFLPKLELPAPDKTPRFELGPGILEGDVTLLTLYGGLYCAVNYSYDFSSYIALYHVTKTAVTRTHTLARLTSGGASLALAPSLSSSQNVLMSVSDNMLLTHCLQTRTTLVFDIQHQQGAGSFSGGSASGGSGGAAVVVAHVEPVAAAAAMELDPLPLQLQGALTGSPPLAPAQAHALALAQAQAHGLPPPPPPSPLLATDMSPAILNATEQEQSGWDAVRGEGEGESEVAGLHPQSSSSAAHSPTPTPTQTQPGQQPLSSSKSSVSAVQQASVYDPSGPFTLLSPLWVWHAPTGTLRRLRVSLAAVAETMHDPRAALAFLSRRGQFASGPYVVFSSHLEDQQSVEAKRLMLERCSSAMRARVGLSWLEALFQALVVPYAAEEARIRALRGGDGAYDGYGYLGGLGGAGGMNSDGSSSAGLGLSRRERSSSGGGLGGSSNSRGKASRAAAAASAAASGSRQHLSPYASMGQFGHNSQGHPKARDSFDRAVEMDLDNSMVTRGMHALNAVVSDARQTLAGYYAALGGAGEAQIEPLEPPHALYLLLPDITAVGNLLQQRENQSGTGSSPQPGTGTGTRPVTETSWLLTSAPVPLVARRDGEGRLVLTQTEMLSHVWLPLILASPADGLAHLTWALQCFVAVLRGVHGAGTQSGFLGAGQGGGQGPIHAGSSGRTGMGGGGGSAVGVSVHPAVSMLLLKLLSTRRRFSEVARLLQMQLFPDSPEVAMLALEISDAIDCGLGSGSGSGSGPGSSSGMGVGFAASLSLRSCVNQLQQVGLDMLWRLGERGTVVRWLLDHGRVSEALSMCQKRRGQWRAGLSPAAVPSSNFFLAALTAVQATRACDDAYDADDATDEDTDQDTDPGVDVDVDADADADADADVDGALAGDRARTEAETGVKNAGRTERDEYVMPQGERVELLHAVFRFLREWDPASLVPSSASSPSSSQSLGLSPPGPRSRLSQLAQFPDHMLGEDHTRRFHELFGYPLDQN